VGVLQDVLGATHSGIVLVRGPRSAGSPVYLLVPEEPTPPTEPPAKKKEPRGRDRGKRGDER